MSKGCPDCGAMSARMGGMETGLAAQAKRLEAYRLRIAELERALADNCMLMVGAHEDLFTLVKLILYHSHRSEYLVTREMIEELPSGLEIYSARVPGEGAVQVRLRRPGEAATARKTRREA